MNASEVVPGVPEDHSGPVIVEPFRERVSEPREATKLHPKG